MDLVNYYLTHKESLQQLILFLSDQDLQNLEGDSKLSVLDERQKKAAQILQIIFYLKQLGAVVGPQPSEVALVIDQEPQMFNRYLKYQEAGRFLSDFVRPTTSLNWFIEKDPRLKDIKNKKDLWCFGNNDGVFYDVYKARQERLQSQPVANS